MLVFSRQKREAAGKGDSTVIYIHVYIVTFLHVYIVTFLQGLKAPLLQDRAAAGAAGKLDL